MTPQELSERWRQQGRDYVSALQAWIAAADGSPQPTDPRGPLAAAVIDAVVAANAAGDWRPLRGLFPPAQEPLIPLLKERARGMGAVRFVDDRRVVVHSGSSWEPDVVAVVDVDGGATVVDARAVCASADRDEWGFLSGKGLVVKHGFDGDVLRTLRAPGGDGVLEDLVLFPGGRAALYARSDGFFVGRQTGLQRLRIDGDDSDEGDEGDEGVSLAMVHGAVSPDGTLMALGHQDSQHLLVRADGTVVGRFGPVGSEYPHHAAFSEDGEKVIFNACHFYNGLTIIAAADALDGFDSAAYERDARLAVVQDGARVYASCAVDDTFILGDAYGYLRCVGHDGGERWRHFCGSTIAGVDVSPDRTKMAVSTAAGWVQIIDLHQPAPDPFQIGTGNHHERLRFLFWRDLPLLRW